MPTSVVGFWCSRAPTQPTELRALAVSGCAPRSLTIVTGVAIVAPRFGHARRASFGARTRGDAAERCRRTSTRSRGQRLRGDRESREVGASVRTSCLLVLTRASAAACHSETALPVEAMHPQISDPIIARTKSRGKSITLLKIKRVLPRRSPPSITNDGTRILSISRVVSALAPQTSAVHDNVRSPLADSRERALENDAAAYPTPKSCAPEKRLPRCCA